MPFSAEYYATLDAFTEADRAWSNELPKLRDARYSPASLGEPGSRLRELHDARHAAMLTWHAVAFPVL